MSVVLSLKIFEFNVGLKGIIEQIEMIIYEIYDSKSMVTKQNILRLGISTQKEMIRLISIEMSINYLNILC